MKTNYLFLILLALLNCNYLIAKNTDASTWSAEVLAPQTPITDANFTTAINTCLSTNPVDGMCSDSRYGAMPDWDVSQVTDMNTIFPNKTNFNGDITAWDVSSVSNMSNMFSGASSFNQNIGSWDVSSVINMVFMFNDASIKSLLKLVNAGPLFLVELLSK